MKSQNILINFYKGELSFAISFWVFYVGLNVLIQALFGILFNNVLELSDQFLFIPTLLIFLPLQIFTLIGVLKSCNNSKIKIIGRWVIYILLAYNLTNNIFGYIWISADTYKNKKNVEVIKKNKTIIPLNNKEAALQCIDDKGSKYFLIYNLIDMNSSVSNKPINSDNQNVIDYELQVKETNQYFLFKNNRFPYVLDLKRLVFRETNDSSSFFKCAYFG